MDPLPRKRFLAYAAGARRRPGFEEDRAARLAAAAAMREALAGSEPGGVVVPLRMHDRPRLPIVGRRRVDWLAQRLRARPDEVGAALARFGEPELDPVDRVAHFAAATGNGDDALAVGSALEFAADPRSNPVVAPRWYEWLERRLGWSGPGSDDSVAGRYARHLAFVRELAALLDEAGIRDAVDVELVVRGAFRHGHIWDADPSVTAPIESVEPAKPSPPSDRAYLSICAIFLDEGPYLREWIEFHRLVGVERFFLYDNASSDGSRRLLAPYERDGTVIVHDWPLYPGQKQAYDHCLAIHREHSRWIAFIDLDEFLFSPTGKPLAAVLPPFESYPAVTVNWVNFGTGGHRDKPPGLVAESYLYRTVDESAARTVKSIVDPTRTLGCIHPHAFRFSSGQAVDERLRPIEHGSVKTEAPSHQLLRVNHYSTKSEAEFELRNVRGGADTGIVRPARKPPQGELRDEVITAYLPALREALGVSDG